MAASAVAEIEQSLKSLRDLAWHATGAMAWKAAWFRDAAAWAEVERLTEVAMKLDTTTKIPPVSQQGPQR